jgi:hypothetical protein
VKRLMRLWETSGFLGDNNLLFIAILSHFPFD